MIEVVPDCVPVEWRELRARRRYLGVTQRELAVLLGMSEHAVRRYEVGDSIPDRDACRKARQLLQRWETDPPARKAYNYKRAYPEPAYERVLATLQAATTPLTATCIVHLSGVCQTSTRQHLETLLNAGIIIQSAVIVPVQRNHQNGQTIAVNIPVTAYILKEKL